MNQVRILQAVGIAVLCLFLGGIVIGIILVSKGIPTLKITNQIIFMYFLPVLIIVQFVIGFWLGRKVGGSWMPLLGHVYLTNIVLFLVNVIIGVISGQSAFWLAAFTPIVALVLSILSYPVALLARRK
jgi:hypothetical protein